MKTDNKMHVQTPDGSSCPLKDNSDVMSIYSNTNLAILLKCIYIIYVLAPHVINPASRRVCVRPF